MKLFFKVSVFILFSIDVASAASLDSITVEDAYVRGLPPSAKNTSAYMTLNNISDETLVLVGARSEIASSVTIHRTENSNGLMTMDHITSVNIPGHEQLVLESGGMHLMLMGLTAPIKPTDVVAITLVFENGSEHLISMPVRSVLDE